MEPLYRQLIRFCGLAVVGLVCEAPAGGGLEGDEGGRCEQCFCILFIDTATECLGILGEGGSHVSVEETDELSVVGC